MGEADHRQAVTLHCQLFELGNDGGRAAISHVFELAGQIGPDTTLRGLANGLSEVGIERLGGVQQQNAETVSGTLLDNALRNQPCGEITHCFRGLQHLLGGSGIYRSAGVEHAIDSRDTQACLRGNSRDGGALIVIHDMPLKRLDRKLSSTADAR
ncbi:Unknown protein sequence [Pseudomonas amygdali pv. morsprunorum]|nr:Unknown protein sequence [Pseudomonas amygdali pv. morsprunorum]